MIVLYTSWSVAPRVLILVLLKPVRSISSLMIFLIVILRESIWGVIPMVLVSAVAVLSVVPLWCGCSPAYVKRALLSESVVRIVP